MNVVILGKSLSSDRISFVMCLTYLQSKYFVGTTIGGGSEDFRKANIIAFLRIKKDKRKGILPCWLIG